MARTQGLERERWPHAWPEEPEGQEGEEYYPEEHGPARPIVNPYAVIALVAALLLLFPVALVFGLIAFSHPRGRVMATFALLLGAAQVAAVAAFFVLPGSLLPETDFLSGSPTTAPPPSTVVVTSVVTATPTAAPAAPAPTVAVPVVRKGATCDAADVGAIGAAEDGGTLLCLATSGARGGYQWSGPYNVGTGLFEPGERCDPSIARTGRTAENRALVCESGTGGQTWTEWTS